MIIQTKYDTVFHSKMDKVELTLAEPFETVVKENFFACYNDDICYSQSQRIRSIANDWKLNWRQQIKITIVDEKQTVDNEIITNIYAIIHFGGHGEERKNGTMVSLILKFMTYETTSTR